MPTLSFPSPFGQLTVTEQGGAITAVTWGTGERVETPLLCEARDQILAYAAGKRQSFELPLSPAGTDFQKRVWQAMLAIPYGQYQTYGEIAQALGSVARAVGGACGANPIPIIIPCHRVLAGGGALGGFSGGEGGVTKRALLAHEGLTQFRDLQPSLPGLL